jgi:proton-translocating NAD(P)+ transhydrogenase subunit alpha
VLVLVLTETTAGERRVAATPDSVTRLHRAGFDVVVQAGAGVAAGYPDVAYSDAGADVVAAPDPADCEVLLHVRPLAPGVSGRLRPSTVTIGFCSPWTDQDSVEALRAAGVTSLAMELVPRITRAQAMDALTSQAMVAGYHSALVAATSLPRFFGMSMTAAGTVPPARVLVLGAGVAGLQSIATAKRLGARVYGYDVREASAEEIRSVGGTSIDLGLPPLTGAGGYAREMTEDRARRQAEALAPHVAAADAVICCAFVPGRPAPRLVTTAMLTAMRAGSVVVDLAAEAGGNAQGSIPGERIGVPSDTGGMVTLIGLADAPSALPADASRLYANNLSAVLLALAPTPEAAADAERLPQVLPIDFDDEVVAACCLTHGGEIRHPDLVLTTTGGEGT